MLNSAADAAGNIYLGTDGFTRLSYLSIADPKIWAKTEQVDSGNDFRLMEHFFSELPAGEQIVFAQRKAVSNDGTFRLGNRGAVTLLEF